MDQQRREVLRYGVVLGLMGHLGLITPAQAAEWSRAAFAEKSLTDVFRVLVEGTPEFSNLLTFTAPEIAENGAVVPVSLLFRQAAQEMAILVEKNPNPLAARCFFEHQTEPFVSTRIKMAETSKVYALVKSQGQWTMAVKEIKVTLGGCGG